MVSCPRWGGKCWLETDESVKQKRQAAEVRMAPRVVSDHAGACRHLPGPGWNVNRWCGRVSGRLPQNPCVRPRLTNATSQLSRAETSARRFRPVTGRHVRLAQFDFDAPSIVAAIEACCAGLLICAPW